MASTNFNSHNLSFITLLAFLTAMTMQLDHPSLSLRKVSQLCEFLKLKLFRRLERYFFSISSPSEGTQATLWQHNANVQCETKERFSVLFKMACWLIAIISERLCKYLATHNNIQHYVDLKLPYLGLAFPRRHDKAKEGGQRRRFSGLLIRDYFASI